jgi:hypothetical protein
MVDRQGARRKVDSAKAEAVVDDALDYLVRQWRDVRWWTRDLDATFHLVEEKDGITSMGIECRRLPLSRQSPYRPLVALAFVKIELAHRVLFSGRS